MPPWRLPIVNNRPALLISLALLTMMFLLSAWAWVQVGPDASVPVHWGVDGTVDRYGSKLEGLLLLPLLTSALVLMFAVIPRIEPRRLNLKQSATAYRIIWISTICLMAGIHVLAVLAALGGQLDMGLVVLIGVGIMYLSIGVALPRVESNYHVGVRTPWTLTSERAWKRTHRLAGWLFAVLGLATIVAAAFGAAATALAVCVGGALTITAVALIYSYVVWRDDPDKDTTGR
jgi:uncharacterized membrane protein